MRIIAATFAAFALAGCAGGVSERIVDAHVERAPVVVAGAWTQRMLSRASGREYQLFLARPDAPAPPEGYPVFYVLDANRIFGTAVETVREYERRSNVTPSVIVGIGYPSDADIRAERALDLTPAPVNGAQTPVRGGGANAFLAFIRDELKPAIAGELPIDAGRETVFGHSFGGLFVLHTVAEEPSLFDTYIAASPSIWWADRLIVEELGRLQPRLEHAQARARLLLTVGEFEQSPDPRVPDPDGARAVRAPLLAANAQIDNAREVANLLGDLQGIAVEFALFTGEDHGTVVPAALSRGVDFSLGSRVPFPAPALAHNDVPGTTRILVPTAPQYQEMGAEARYALRLEVRNWPQEERQRFLSQLKYNLDSTLSFEEHYALHLERNAMDQARGTRPPE